MRTAFRPSLPLFERAEVPGCLSWHMAKADQEGNAGEGQAKDTGDDGPPEAKAAVVPRSSEGGHEENDRSAGERVLAPDRRIIRVQLGEALLDAFRVREA